MTGNVTLVGAGTGRKGLITLEGAKALKETEVVVYDRLLGEGVSELIPDSAEKINVGKESGKHTVPQNEINEILIGKAREGKRVVRLKGGDSYLFGRGGEEAEMLFKAGIPFKVIPGVTSALAAPLFAGIPVTHRDCSSSVHIFSAHKKDGGKPDIDFNACVRIGGTLVFLMGIRNLSYIAEGLLGAGMREDMPCAIIENGGSPWQRKVVSVLGDIAEKGKNFRSPSVIVVGDVCQYSDRLDFYSGLPLKGKKIIIASPAERAGTLADSLRELGASAEILPCISTEPIASEICSYIEKSDVVVFTSIEGVNRAARQIFKEGRDARIFGGKLIGAVGNKTAAELMRYGLRADIVPEKHSGERLAEALCRKNLDNILILRAEKGAADITKYLEKRGRTFTDRAVYRTHIIRNRFENADYVVFASISEVMGFIENKKTYTGVCAGKKTAAKARELGIKCICAKSTDDEDIISAIINDIGRE